MECPECQFENRDGAKFCNECGYRFDVICPECSISNRVGSKFCDECGHDLRATKEPPTINYSEPQSYTPKHLTDKILTSRSSIEGERKLVTVLFADVANFTTISEKLDPEEVHQIMDGCFKILMGEIHRYEGTINQFTGDGVMALFGAPISHEDHAQRACLAALAIQNAMVIYSEKIKSDSDIVFKLRIGMNSGPVVVGAIGDDLRMDYTAVGDTTNLAMRMETMAESGNIQISENTHRQIKAYFDCEDLGSMPVKGKKEPQQTYKLIKASEVQTRFEASMTKGLVRFVGRKSSMAAINSAWNKALERTGQVLGVVGEAGVGKSRLLLEFRHSLKNSDFNYLEGRCLHYGGSMAYLPFLDIVKSFFEIGEGQRDDLVIDTIREKLTSLNQDLLLDSQPAFQDLLSLKVDDKSWLKLEPQIKRERTFEALRNLLIRFSEKRPLIIAVEDLHWMDKTSEEFLGYLIDSMANSPILLILLYRPEYTHQWGSKSYYSKIGLDQLTMKTSCELVSAILKEGEVASELKELILSRSAGNPLFMEEFTHTLLENGSIESRNSEFVLSKKISDIQVPETIQGIIAARIDRLEEDLKRTMQVASVIGRDFAYRILQAITGMREKLKSYLVNLQGLEFIYEKSLFPDLEYIFKHALTQEVAYNSLLLARRKKIHEEIGKAIEELYAHRLEEFYEILAYHYLKSDQLEKAKHYLKLSGQKATKNFSNWEAFGYFKNAIKILKKQPETQKNKKEHLEIINLMGSSMHQIGLPEESFQILQDGVILSQEFSDHNSLSGLYSLMGTYFTYKGDHLKGIKYSEKSFRTARKIQDVELISGTAQGLCTSYFMSGENQKVIDVAPSAIHLLEKTKNESIIFAGGFNSYSILCGYCGVSFGFLGNFAKGQEFCERGFLLAKKTGHPPSIGWIETLYGYFFAIKGNGENTVKYFRNALTNIEKGQVAFMLGLPSMRLGWGYYLLGELNKALKFAKNGLEIQVGTGNPFYLSLIHRILGMIYFDIGDLKNAHSCTQQALELSQQTGEKHLEAPSWILLGKILLKTDSSQINKATDNIYKGIKICEELEIKAECAVGYLFLGELYAYAGRQERASENLRKAKFMFQEMEMDFWLTKTQNHLETL